MIELQNITQPSEEELLNQCRQHVDQVLAYDHVGFIEQLSRQDEWDLAEEIGQRFAEKYQRMVVIGIGGSALGARTLEEIFQGLEKANRVDFLENVDARYFWDFVRTIDDFTTTCWLIVSKSGSTMETLSISSYLSQHMKQNGHKLSDHALVISEPKSSALVDWANDHKVEVAPIPLDVGGRFSVLTCVGLIPAAFMGVRLEDIQKGAGWVLEQKDLLAELTAQSLQSFSRDEMITIFWMYTQRLNHYGRWIQQLWAESLGKKVDRNGGPAPKASTPIPAIGAVDQHSILQQVMEGQKDKFVWFFRVGDAEEYGPTLESAPFANVQLMEGRGLGELMAAEAKATRDALQEEGVQSLTLSFRSLTPGTAGALFMLLEVVVAAVAEAHQINAFDQPGVELGKKLAKQYLNR